MIIRCCARICTSDENTTINGEKIKFFRFPKDIKLQQQWESVCTMFNGKGKYKHLRSICELHFDRNCFNQQNQLKPDAIPINTQIKRSAKQAEIELRNEFPKQKLRKISPATMEPNINSIDTKVAGSNGLNSKPYRLTIQVHKVCMRPCPKSKKINQTKINLDKAQSLKNENIMINTQSSSQYAQACEKEKQNCHQCVICKKTFLVTSILYVHLKKHLTCDICETEFRSIKSREKHYELHKSNIAQFPYECHICGMLFDEKNAIKKHHHLTLNKYSGLDKNDIQYYKPSQITFRDKSPHRKRLNSHVARTDGLLENKNRVHNTLLIGHGRPVILSCRLCDKQFENISEIDEHTKSHIQELKSEWTD